MNTQVMSSTLCEFRMPSATSGFIEQATSFKTTRLIEFNPSLLDVISFKQKSFSLS